VEGLRLLHQVGKPCPGPGRGSRLTRRLASIDGSACISLFSEIIFSAIIVRDHSNRRVQMKKLAILILVAVGLMVLSCARSTLPPLVQTTTTGNWEAQLVGGRGDASQLNFVTTFEVLNTNGGTTEPLSITAFGFFNSGKCFVTQTPSGSSNLTTLTTNQVTGTMSYTVQSLIPTGNTLTLTGTSVTGTSNNGTLTNGIVTGTWSLTGGQGDPSCVGEGNFTMCQNAATCSPT
jgi:hypothetical protein